MRSEAGRYGVKLTRAPPDSGGKTLVAPGHEAATSQRQRPTSEFDHAERAVRPPPPSPPHPSPNLTHFGIARFVVAAFPCLVASGVAPAFP